MQPRAQHVPDPERELDRRGNALDPKPSATAVVVDPKAQLVRLGVLGVEFAVRSEPQLARSHIAAAAETANLSALAH